MIPPQHVCTNHPYVQEVTRRSSESDTRFSSKLAVSAIKLKLGRDGWLSTPRGVFLYLLNYSLCSVMNKWSKGISGTVIMGINCNGCEWIRLPKRCRYETVLSEALMRRLHLACQSSCWAVVSLFTGRQLESLWLSCLKTQSRIWFGSWYLSKN